MRVIDLVAIRRATHHAGRIMVGSTVLTLVATGLALTLAVEPAVARQRYSHAFEVWMGDDSRVVFHSQEERACWALGIDEEQHNCLYAHADAWEVRLAKAYRQKLATLSPSRRAALTAGQRHWRHVLEPFCKRRVYTGGGNLAPLIIDSCWLSAVKKRTRDVERFH